MDRISQGLTWGHSFGTTNILKFNKLFKNVHSVNALLGHEYGCSDYEYMNVVTSGLKNGMQVLNGTKPENIYGTKTEAASWSLFAQAQYSYNERYFFNATFRADASSVFAPKNKVGYFPAGSFAWLISNEDFMKSQDVVSFLKLRASYGLTGNSNIGNYKYLDIYGFNERLQYQGVQGAYPETVANPYLHWETAVMRNLGIDVSFRNFLTLNIDVTVTLTGSFSSMSLSPSLRLSHAN